MEVTGDSTGRFFPKGVKNLGHSCYLSVLLQKIYHNDPLRRGILSFNFDKKNAIENLSELNFNTVSGQEILISANMLGNGLELLIKLMKNLGNRHGRATDVGKFFSCLGFKLNSNEDPNEVWQQIFLPYLEYMNLVESWKFTINTTRRFIESFNNKTQRRITAYETDAYFLELYDQDILK